MDRNAAASLGALAKYFSLHSYDCGSGVAELNDLYALRYQIYCLECHFLNAARYPDGLETDAYDARSAHFSATNAEGVVAGTARLVMPVQGAGQGTACGASTSRISRVAMRSTSHRAVRNASMRRCWCWGCIGKSIASVVRTAFATGMPRWKRAWHGYCESMGLISRPLALRATITAR